MRSLIRNAGFWLLLFGQSVSTLGDVLYEVAVLAFVYGQTGSVLGTAGVLILTTLARLVAGFFAVQVIDRFSNRTLMVASDLVRGAVVGFLGVAAWFRPLGMPEVYGVTAAAAFASAFFSPARSAILPQIVAREDLVRANGLVASQVQLAQTAAWAVGALIVASLGTSLVILLNAGSFLISAAATSLIPRVPGQSPESAKRERPFEQLKAGWNHLWSSPVVRDVTLMDSFEALANTIWSSALMLAFTGQVLGVGKEWWGYQSAAYFFGSLAGGVVAVAAATWLSRWGGWAVVFSSGGFALLTAWYALNQNAPLAVALCVIFGPVYQLRDVVQSSMLQASLDPRLIGRTFATREMLLMTLVGPAMALMSLFADMAGLRAAYLLGAGLYAVAALVAAASAPIRTYRIVPAPRQFAPLP